MRTVIASENPAASSRLRKALAARGYDCPVSHVIPLEGVDASLPAFSQGIDLLLVVLPNDSGRSTRIIHKLRSKTNARIVAVGPASDARRILEMLRAGADDYLDEDADTFEQLAASLERLAIQSAARSTAGSVLAITAASGGSGCSLIASNLSVLVARRQESCGLLDLSSQYGDLAAMLNLEPRHSIAELCRHEDSLDPEMFTQSLTPHESGVQLIAAPASENDSSSVTLTGLERILQLARRQFGWTLVDLGASMAGRSALLRSCDKVIVPFRLDFTSLCNTRRMLDDWERREIDLSRVVLVGNRQSQAGELPRQKVATILGRPVASWLLDEPLTANLSVNCGVPVVVESPRSPLGSALSQLADGQFSFSQEPPAGGDPAEKTAIWSKLRLLPRMAGMVF
jgi:pilus assembly protein CpaE